MRPILVLSVLGLLLSLLVGCAASGAGPATTGTADASAAGAPGEERGAIRVGGQLALPGDTVRIGAGNVAGATVGLWIFVRDQPALEWHTRAGEGDVLLIPDGTGRVFRVRVLAVEAAWVALAVSEEHTDD